MGVGTRSYVKMKGRNFVGMNFEFAHSRKFSFVLQRASEVEPKNRIFMVQIVYF